MRNEIVVGLDDSPSSKAALDWAAEQARRVGAVLRAVHVLDWPYGLSPAGFPAPANFMDVSREELQDSYRRWITAVFDAVSPRPEWILQFASGSVPARSWFDSLRTHVCSSWALANTLALAGC